MDYATIPNAGMENTPNFFTFMGIPIPIFPKICGVIFDYCSIRNKMLQVHGDWLLYSWCGDDAWAFNQITAAFRNTGVEPRYAKVALILLT